MLYVMQETANVQSCYHTSKVTHLVDVFGFGVLTCSLFTCLFVAFILVLLLFEECAVGCYDVVFDEGKTLALTETL